MTLPCKRSQIGRGGQSYDTRHPDKIGIQSHVPATFNVYLFLEFTISNYITFRNFSQHQSQVDVGLFSFRIFNHLG